MSTPTAPTYVCIVQTTELTGLMMTRPDENKIVSIQGFESLQDGLRYFEDAYNDNHKRGYEASMSACINAIFFRPSIVKIDLGKIKGLIDGEPHVLNVRNNSGSMRLLPLIPELATPIWESGEKPKLITF